MAVDVKPRKIRVAEFEQMFEAGVFSPDDRLELLDGFIFEMSPIGSHHGSVVNRLTSRFVRQLGSVGQVRVQTSIRLDDYSEPQPDLVILKPRDDHYEEKLPTRWPTY